MSASLNKKLIHIPTEQEDEQLTVAALSNPDALPLTDEQLQKMQPFKQLRGRPKAAQPKQLVSIRYDAEVINYFKATGDGWQSRMNAVLADYVHKHS